jgi:hypothetical protein
MVNDTPTPVVTASHADISARDARPHSAWWGACALLVLLIALGIGTLGVQALHPSQTPGVRQMPLSQQIADGTPPSTGPCGGIAAGC